MGCGDCVKQIVRGSIGLAKVAIGADPAPAEEVHRRRDICRACPHATRSKAARHRATKGLTNFSRCQECGCVIAAKTKLASESCPLAKWGPVTGPHDRSPSDG